jgi:hypothetical protein
MFPSEADPKGDPETWTREELRRWLAAVCRPRAGGLTSIADMRGRETCILKTQTPVSSCLTGYGQI